MPLASPIPRWRKWLLAAALASATSAAVVLFVFDPARSSFYPVCPWHELFGWSCPGCGTLRALHQLTHGHLAAAWRFNPLAVALLPAAFWLVARELAWQLRGQKWPGLITRPFFAWALLALVLVFGIVRNLPGFHS